MSFLLYSEKLPVHILLTNIIFFKKVLSGQEILLIMEVRGYVKDIAVIVKFDTNVLGKLSQMMKVCFMSRVWLRSCFNLINQQIKFLLSEFLSRK